MNQQLSYNEEVAIYTKKDGVHALLYAAYTGILGFIYFQLVDVFGFFADGRLSLAGELLGLVMIPFALVPLFIILRKKRQNLCSVGLHLTGWKKSLLAGLCFVVIVVIFASVLPGLIFGWRLGTPTRLVWLAVYLLIMATWEDIVYVGFMQTRVYGLVKKDFWAIALGGFMFAAIHYPNFFFRHFANGGSFDFDFFMPFLMSTISWIIMHVVYNQAFRGFRSIIPVALLHFSFNMARREDLWYYTGDGSLNEFVVPVVAILAAFFIIPAIFIRRKEQETSI